MAMRPTIPGNPRERASLQVVARLSTEDHDQPPKAPLGINAQGDQTHLGVLNTPFSNSPTGFVKKRGCANLPNL